MRQQSVWLQATLCVAYLQFKGVLSMKTAISAHQFVLTDRLHTYAEDKLQKSIAPMVDDTATHLNITLSQHQGATPDANMECRVHLALAGSAPIAVHKAASDMYAAINLVHDTLLKTIRARLGHSHDRHHQRLDAQRHRAQIARSALNAQE